MWRLAAERPAGVENETSSKMKAQWRLQIQRRMLAVICMAVILNRFLGRMRRQSRAISEHSSSSVQCSLVVCSVSIVSQTSLLQGQRNRKCGRSSCAWSQIRHLVEGGSAPFPPQILFLRTPVGIFSCRVLHQIVRAL